MQEEKDEVVKSVFIEVLEQALLKEQAAEGKKNRAYFEYSYMQIYSAEDIIAKCIKTLSSTNNSEKVYNGTTVRERHPGFISLF